HVQAVAYAGELGVCLIKIVYLNTVQIFYFKEHHKRNHLYVIHIFSNYFVLL
ncbi:hypothetical protein ACJX0J_029525, partial [Zea mays]